MTDPTDTLTPETPVTDPTTATLARMNEISEQISRLIGERVDLGRTLPPVRYRDLLPDRCNFRDRSFERDVDEFKQTHMNAIDVTLLDREDPDKWELLTPRYESREIEGGYAVWDYDTGTFVTQEDEDGNAGQAVFDDAGDADERMCDLQSEAEESRCGFPFAWNTGWVVENTYWLDEMRAAGFLVYRYDGDTLIAGIDGGGYSFKGAHFAPLYAALAVKNGWMVRTNAGPRYLTLE
jgi:hypothetical protein